MKFLLPLAAILLAVWAISDRTALRRLPSIVRSLLALLFVVLAVRVALGFSILAFGLTPLSVALAAVAGVAAWLVRPGRHTLG